MNYKKILETIPSIKAASLAGSNIKDLEAKPKKKPKLVKSAVKNIVGISLIKTEADLIAEL